MYNVFYPPTKSGAKYEFLANTKITKSFKNGFHGSVPLVHTHEATSWIVLPRFFTMAETMAVLGWNGGSKYKKISLVVKPISQKQPARNI
jgi:hypothetical protein